MQFKYPTNLPISEYSSVIIETLQQTNVLIVAGDTGSGKTTQLPKMCLEIFPDAKGLIGCTQPRRIAATTVAARVSDELGEYGACVSHKIRFNDRTHEGTKIKFMTDGILLAETRHDKLLKKYKVIIIDEAHERSLNIDFLLGYLKQILPKRPDLKVIITSATIDTEAFSKHFDKAPIISIGGKTHPVELRYNPPELDDYGEYENYIDHCIQSVYDLFMHEPPGDMLVFLPTEKDIRNCCELLTKKLENALVLPLFGRLHSADQKQIFKSFAQTKIIVATNVAETSITVPGIRYVVDTGLARMAYYNFRAKTNSLPIRKVSRSSCDQRKGRCGRVAPGICIRLFSEEDFQNREEFTTPEIRRSNLADVILQMLSFNLGDPLSFPFIDPPHPSAIRDGYKLLNELGALDDKRNLTHIGKTMASLPIDPCIARIIIEAKSNNCLTEIKIIGSALAIQDPRVRPSGFENKADLIHKEIAHPQSDFLSLLNIWNLFHDGKTKISWSRLKKLCKSHFLSFQRIREWIDLHEQMSNILKRKDKFIENEKDASYDEIHKSLAIGFLRNLAVKKEAKIYIGPANRELMIFPGSHQFAKNPQWIVAASFLETSRLYALSVASINPEWLENLGGELCKYSWSEPRYQKKSSQVVANEKVTLFGLVIVAARIVNFGRTNSDNQKEARNIFMQSALVEGLLRGTYPFLQNNIELIKKWEDVEHQLRSRDIIVHNDTLFQFYDDRIPSYVFDRHSLNRFLKRNTNRQLLFLKEEDILSRKPGGHELSDYPPQLSIGSHDLVLEYLFDPVSPNDGVTVKIPVDLCESLNSDIFEWLIPGLIKEKTTFLLKGLPKKLRKHLIPLNITVEKILDDLIMYRGSYIKALEQSIFKQFKINIKRSDWPEPIPSHLKMRFFLFDLDGKQVAVGRNFNKLRAPIKTPPNLSHQHASEESRKIIKKWESLLVSTWDFKGLSDKFPLFTPDGHIAGYLYPAITPVTEKAAVTISFYPSRAKAGSIHQQGVQYLYRLYYSQQYRALKNFCSTALSGPSAHWLINVFENKKSAQDSILGFVLNNLFQINPSSLLSHDDYLKRINSVGKSEFFKKGSDICNSVFSILRNRREAHEQILRYDKLDRKSKSYSKNQNQVYSNLLFEIVPENFLEIKSIEDFENMDRYLRSLSIRIDRAHADFQKDNKKAQTLEPFVSHLQKSKFDIHLQPDDCRYKIEEFERMIQEMRISLFSPEIKTRFPVSLKKLSLAWKEINGECG